MTLNDSSKINYSAQPKIRRRMVSYLKLGSCKVILGKKRPDEIIRKRQRFTFILAGIIILFGLYFVLF